ncbi:MAG: hypothetical protein CL808_06870 [Citromicrobium sp.]|nr:hypothetical protein [Citromicrobium sp.]
MMGPKLTASLLGAPLLLAACAGSTDSSDDAISAPDKDADNPAAGTRPSGEPQLLTLEGRIEEGLECPVLRTPDGETYALSFRDTELGPGDYVRVSGEIADASFCMQGQGTLIVQDASKAEPPARDRDPARAGGIALTSQYVRGSWVAKGVDADCARPDFDVTANSRGMSIIETRVNGYPETGVVDVGPTPALQWDEPLPTLPIEARGPDGLAVMPAEGADPVTLAGHRIEGDGVVFVKCAD